MYQRQKKNARHYIIKHFVYLFIFCCIIWFLPSRPQVATIVTRKTMYIGDSYTLKINGKIRDGKLDVFQSTYSICDRKGKNTGKVQSITHGHISLRENDRGLQKER